VRLHSSSFISRYFAAD